MAKSLKEPVRVQPFLDWVDAQLSKQEQDTQTGVRGDDRPLSPLEAVLALIGWSGEAGARRLFRWRNGDLVSGMVERATVEDALDHAGVFWWEVYPDGSEIGAPEELEPPPSNRPDLDERERCACGRRKIAYARRCETCTIADRGPDGRPRRVYTDADLVCPDCEGPKTESATRCRTCHYASGAHRVPHRAKPMLITEPQLADAYRLYLTGLSLRKVAEQILDETGYKGIGSCSMGLARLWEKRGWPRRDRIQASRQATVVHGLSRKDPAAAKRWRRREKGIQPRCKGVRTNYPRKGEPCQAFAAAGSDFCWSHDPANRDAVVAHLKQTRALPRAGFKPAAYPRPEGEPAETPVTAPEGAQDPYVRQAA